MTMPSNNNNNNSNPNLRRSSEINNPMRRSSTGNPFSKPSSNTPSDFPKRSSAGVIRDNGGSLRDMFDDKENMKDQILKPSKIRSPTVSKTTTTKNFMSPTISASFKVAESPRKKILSERNETASPILTPTPSSDPKFNVRKVTFADPLEQKKLDASLLDEICEDLSSEILNDDLSFDTIHFTDMNDPLTLKNNTDLSFDTVSQEPDFVNLDPTFKISPIATPAFSSPPVSSMTSVLAPLDADPLMPPYDPKTNYLSPRPQFLHYKPKPRMELGSRQREFEEALLSGSFSDTEVTEDTQSEASQKESEDASSEEVVTQEEEQQISEAQERPKRCFSLRSKAVALILLLSVAFASISVINSPQSYHTVLEDFYEAYESSEFPEFARANFDRFSQFATTNFDGLARNLHIWFTNSLSSISELVSSVRGLDNLQYFNLTMMPDYSVPNQYPIFGTEIGHIHPPVQESDAASEIGTDDDYIEDISAENYEIHEEQLQQDIGITTGVEDTMIESEQALQLAEVEYLDTKVEQEIGSSSIVEVASESEEVLEDQPATSIVSEHEVAKLEGNDDSSSVENMRSSYFEAAEVHNEVCVVEGNALGNDAAKLNVVKNGDVISEVAETYTDIHDDAEIKGNEKLYLLVFAGTIIIAGATFSWSKKDRSKKVIEQPKNVEFLAEKNKETFFQDNQSLRNVPVKLDDLGGSCPSEMSSFENENSSSYTRRKVVVSEATSVEKKRSRNNNHNRRESLASSDYSMGSPSSYGSLTMYQKIPKGRGEEEIVTPVRRSSRIRSIATSPV